MKFNFLCSSPSQDHDSFVGLGGYRTEERWGQKEAPGPIESVSSFETDEGSSSKAPATWCGVRLLPAIHLVMCVSSESGTVPGTWKVFKKYLSNE